MIQSVRRPISEIVKSAPRTFTRSARSSSVLSVFLLSRAPRTQSRPNAPVPDGGLLATGLAGMQPG